MARGVMKRLRNRHIGPGSRWPTAPAIGCGLILCGLLAGCGDRVPATPGTPATVSPTSPTPTPSPTVTSAGYLHVLQHPWVMTYEIDPTGRLRPPVTQRLSKDLKALAGEPRGRFVYGEHGGWSAYQGEPAEGSDEAIVTYAPDRRDGTLAEVSEQTVSAVPAAPSSCCSLVTRWEWLSGGANRVHGLLHSYWFMTGGPHDTYVYVSVPVASDGYLGPVSWQPFPEDSDPGDMMVDVRSDVLYKVGLHSGLPGQRLGGLEAHVIGPDGTLTRMGWTNLCLASTVGDYDGPSPLVSARGFVFASASLPIFSPVYKTFPTVCAYQGLRLKPLYALDLSASAAQAFVPSSEAEPALLAMNVRVSTGGPIRQELRVTSMNGEGDLRPVYSEEVPDSVTQILFHPSGRFLYTRDYASRLRAYTVDSDGRLELTMSIDRAGGSMAVTLKDAPAEDR